MYQLKTALFASILAINSYVPASQASDYFTGVGDKFLRGSANLFTGLGEVPKNIANASDNTNPVVGSVGGLVMGTLDTLGRTASGIVDIISSPVPSESLVQPEYVWNDFTQPTAYGSTYLK